MEDILSGGAPTDDDICYETTESLAEPLLACYWSLWECGSGIVAEGMPGILILCRLLPDTQSHCDMPDTYRHAPTR